MYVDSYINYLQTKTPYNWKKNNKTSFGYHKFISAGSKKPVS